MIDIPKSREYLELFDGDVEQAIASLREAAQSHDAPKVTETNVNTTKPIVVDVSGVSKTYLLGHQKVDAVREVTLQIRQGEFVAITGTSGSGKSTLLQLIGGLDKPSSGTVTVDGHDISTLGDHELSSFRNRTIGFVFQFFYLQPFLKLRQNLEVPGMLAHMPEAELTTRAIELAKIVGLHERLEHLPKELSGGQMQRAAIARALFNQPKILLADEPTGNLDSANSDAIVSLFERIRQELGTTIIIITHDRGIARRADREVYLKDGAVV